MDLADFRFWIEGVKITQFQSVFDVEDKVISAQLVSHRLYLIVQAFQLARRYCLQEAYWLDGLLQTRITSIQVLHGEAHGRRF
jgi:hypothetical protein